MSNGWRWFKSSYSSGSGGECLEAASDVDAIHIRDSKKNPDGPTLTVSGEAWTAFLTLPQAP